MLDRYRIADGRHLPNLTVDEDACSAAGITQVRVTCSCGRMPQSAADTREQALAAHTAHVDTVSRPRREGAGVALGRRRRRHGDCGRAARLGDLRGRTVRPPGAAPWRRRRQGGGRRCAHRRHRSRLRTDVRGGPAPRGPQPDLTFLQHTRSARSRRNGCGRIDVTAQVRHKTERLAGRARAASGCSGPVPDAEPLSPRRCGSRPACRTPLPRPPPNRPPTRR